MKADLECYMQGVLMLMRLYNTIPHERMNAYIVIFGEQPP